MNKDDIIRMAREAGMDAPREIVVNNYWTADYDDIERFAALVAAAEREACANVCATHAKVYAELPKTMTTDAAWAACVDLSGAIRARDRQ